MAERVAYYPGIDKKFPPFVQLNHSEHQALVNYVQDNSGIVQITLETGISATVLKAALALEPIRGEIYRTLLGCVWFAPSANIQEKLTTK